MAGRGGECAAAAAISWADRDKVVRSVSGTGREARGGPSREDGVSLLEYVLLVALVAMVCCGTLLYLGRGSASPRGAANGVANNLGTTGSVSSAGLRGGVARTTDAGATSAEETPASGSVKAWC